MAGSKKDPLRYPLMEQEDELTLPEELDLMYKQEEAMNTAEFEQVKLEVRSKTPDMSETSTATSFDDYYDVIDKASDFLFAESMNRNVEKANRKRKNNSFFACISRHNSDHLKIRVAVKTLVELDMGAFQGVFLLEHAARASEQTDAKEYGKKLHEDFMAHLTNLEKSDTPVTDVDIFAAASFLKKPIYILAPLPNDEETLFWKYYPPVIPTPPTDEYVTLLQSGTLDDCPRFFRIVSSSDTPVPPPAARGVIGEFQRLLSGREVRTISVPGEIIEMSFRTAIATLRCSHQTFFSKDDVDNIVAVFENDEEMQITMPSSLRSHRTKTKCECLFDYLESMEREDFIFFCQILIHLNLREQLESIVAGCLTKERRKHLVNICFKEQEYLRKFEDIFNTVVAQIDQVITTCDALATELRERREKVNIASIVGSSVGAAGGIAAIVGIALAPVTFGVSLGLTIAGGTLGALGGATTAGARITELVKQNEGASGLESQTNDLATGYKQLDEAWTNLIEAFNMGTESSFRMSGGPETSNVKAVFAVGSIIRSLKGLYAIPIAALRVTGAAAQVAAAILGPITLAIDIAFLADAAHNLHTGNNSTTSENIMKAKSLLAAQNLAFCSMVRGRQK